MKKRKKRVEEARREALVSEPVLSLLEMFSVLDDVFTTEGAFEEDHINKSLGRCYRQWKATRQVLDPAFDPKRYPKKQRPAKDQSISTTGRKMIFATSPTKNGKKGRGALS